MKTQQKSKVSNTKNCPRKVTKKRVEDFYKKLNIYAGYSIPIGEFKLFDRINVTESSNAGV